jgi:hypothetical protein
LFSSRRRWPSTNSTPTKSEREVRPVLYRRMPRRDVVFSSNCHLRYTAE